MLVSIIIPVYNRLKYTQNCIASLQETLKGRDDVEIIVVDNGSTDGTRAYLAKLPPPFRAIYSPENLGYSRANNLGARSARGKYLVFLNNDTVATANWLEALLAVVGKDENTGIVGSKLLYPGGTIQHAGILLACSPTDPLFALHVHRHRPGDFPPANQQRAYQAVTGACLLIRREVFWRAGGFDTGFINGYEDVDLCLKAGQLGYRVVYCPASVLYHYESVSAGRFDHVHHNVALLHGKWLGRVRPDVVRGGARRPVSIVLATRNSSGVLKRCLARLLRATRPGDQLIIVDDASTDGTREFLRALNYFPRPGVQVLFSSRSVGRHRACSMGAARCVQDQVIFLRPEALVTKNWLNLLKYLRGQRVGAVGPVTNAGAGKQWLGYHAGGDLRPRMAVEELAASVAERNRGRAVEAKFLGDFCLAVNRTLLQEIKLGKEKALTGNFELDLCRHLRARGKKLFVATDAFVYSESDGVRYRLQQVTDLLANKQNRREGKGPWGSLLLLPTRKLTSIVIPCFNQLTYTRQCLQSIFRYTREPLEIIAINNGSTDGTLEYLERLARRKENVKVITNEANLGYGAACNQGIAAAVGDYILILNNDTVVTGGWLARLLAAAEALRGVGICGPRSNEVNGVQKLHHVPYRDLAGMHAFARQLARRHSGEYFPVDRVIGFCILVKREVFAVTGGFDLRYGLGNFEDDDLCLRARLAGFNIVVLDDVFIHHYGGRTFHGNKLGHDRLMAENWKKFKEKWGLPRDLPLEAGYDPRQIAVGSFDFRRHYCPLAETPAKQELLARQLMQS